MLILDNSGLILRSASDTSSSNAGSEESNDSTAPLSQEGSSSSSQSSLQARLPGPGEVELAVIPSPCVAFPAERFKMKVLSPNLRAALSSVLLKYGL